MDMEICIFLLSSLSGNESTSSRALGNQQTRYRRVPPNCKGTFLYRGRNANINLHAR